jgi:hypothetical protein
MSITTARGIGDAFLATTALGNGSGAAQWMFPFPAFNFEESVESESVEAQAQVGGILQTAEAGRSTVTRTLTLTTQIINTSTRPLIYNQLAKTFSNPGIEVSKQVTLDDTETIEDAAITTANLQSIKVFKLGFGRLTPTALAATAPANATEVQIDTTNNELVFFAGEEGATIAYTVPIVATSAKGFGGPGTKTPLGRLSFRCAVFGLDESLVEYRYYPALDLVSEPTQALSGGIPELTLEYLAATPPGWTDPYQVIEADTIVLPD